MIVNIDTLTSPIIDGFHMKLSGFFDFFQLYPIKYDGINYYAAIATNINGVIDTSYGFVTLPCPPYCSNKRSEALIEKNRIEILSSNPKGGVFRTSEVVSVKDNGGWYVYLLSYDDSGAVKYGFIGADETFNANGEILTKYPKIFSDNIIATEL